MNIGVIIFATVVTLFMFIASKLLFDILYELQKEDTNKSNTHH